MNITINREIKFSWLCTHIAPLEPNKHLSIEQFSELIDSSINFTLWLDKEPIGYSRWVSDTQVFSSLCDLYVVPERRRQGYATRLLEHNLNHRLISPTVKLLRYSNEESRKLYTKLAFYTVADRDNLMISYANPDFIKNI